MNRFRTRYDVVLGYRYIGDKIKLDIRRDGKPKTVEVELKKWSPLVPRSRYDEPPQYFVYGGLVFQTLTRDYLTTWDKWWNKAPKEFLNYYYLGYRTAEQHEVVILTQILADEINVGYAPPLQRGGRHAQRQGAARHERLRPAAVERARRRRDRRPRRAA